MNFVDMSHHFFIAKHQNNLQSYIRAYITENTIGSFIERAVISAVGPPGTEPSNRSISV